MIITACGEGCLKIQTSGVTLMTEPFSGPLSSRFKPDIVLASRYDPAAPFGDQEVFTVRGPGEYEIKGVEIFGYPNGVYLVKAEEMKVGIIANETGFANADPLEDADILFLPAIDGAEKIVKQLEPKLVVPTTADSKELARVFNQKPALEEKLTIKKKELPAQGPQLRALTW